MPSALQPRDIVRNRRVNVLNRGTETKLLQPTERKTALVATDARHEIGAVPDLGTNRITESNAIAADGTRHLVSGKTLRADKVRVIDLDAATTHELGNE